MDIEQLERRVEWLEKAMIRLKYLVIGITSILLADQIIKWATPLVPARDAALIGSALGFILIMAPIWFGLRWLYFYGEPEHIQRIK
jgi:hypothetical protein